MCFYLPQQATLIGFKTISSAFTPAKCLFIHKCLVSLSEYMDILSNFNFVLEVWQKSHPSQTVPSGEKYLKGVI